MVALFLLMSNQIYILKTAKYSPLISGLSKYDSFDLVTTGQFSPSIVATAKEILSEIDKKVVLEADFIFHSQALRTKQTATNIKDQLAPNAKLFETPNLNEVFFSLKSLISKDLYEKEGSNAVRRIFIDDFIKDQTIEKREMLRGRIDDLFTLLRSKKYQNKKTVCVSHSFFMKIIEVYLINPNLFEDPSLLAKQFNPLKRTFDFCQGFPFLLPSKP